MKGMQTLRPSIYNSRAAAHPRARSSGDVNQTQAASTHVGYLSLRGCGSASFGATGVPQLRTAGRVNRVCAARAASTSNSELLAGDVLVLVVFCLYKQIMSIASQPSYEGLLAPATFNPAHFAELVSVVLIATGTWVGSSLLLGEYGAAPGGAACCLDLLPPFR